MRARKRTDRYSLEQSPLYGLKGLGGLAALLKCSADDFAELRDATLEYKAWDEPKPSGGTRRIENPPRRLKLVQARISKLLMRIVPPDLLFCPVAKRSALQGAARHFGARQLWTIDIKNYFPSTKREDVYRFFKDRLKLAGDLAGLLTDLVCYQGRLPQGAPTSPILAYFANAEAWLEIERLCLQAQCKVTLWVDDLTVSGDRVSASLRWSIQSVLRKAGLRYHKEQFGSAKRLKLTGIIVSAEQYEVPYSYYRGLREMRRSIRRSAPSERPDLRKKLNGKLAYGRLVRSAAAELGLAT